MIVVFGCHKFPIPVETTSAVYMAFVRRRVLAPGDKVFGLMRWSEIVICRRRFRCDGLQVT